MYLGRSPAGRAVALKVLHEERARDPAFRARFWREVAAARQVSGAYTAAVLDAGAEEGRHWLATVFVAGPSLLDLVCTHGPLPLAAAWRLAGGLVEALTAVHACGLVHRDLKPANVLLAADGPRVIDFGLSRVVDNQVPTLSGLVSGTPGFMSPEQAKGDPVGPASDVFSLGSLLVFASAGSGPFGMGSPVTIMDRIVHGRPDLSRRTGTAARAGQRVPGQRPGQPSRTGRVDGGHRAASAAGCGCRARLLLAGSGDQGDPVAPGQPGDGEGGRGSRDPGKCREQPRGPGKRCRGPGGPGDRDGGPGGPGDHGREPRGPGKRCRGPRGPGDRGRAPGDRAEGPGTGPGQAPGGVPARLRRSRRRRHGTGGEPGGRAIPAAYRPGAAGAVPGCPCPGT